MGTISRGAHTVGERSIHTVGERNVGERSVHTGGVHTLVEHCSAHSGVLWESTKLGECSELLRASVIFLDWRQNGAPGWIEARTGCGSIDFIGGAEWIRGCGALRALDLYLIWEAAEERGAFCGLCVVLNT